MIRLFVSNDLTQGAQFPATEPQYHYLAHVMRAAIGDDVLLFNGRDGEWQAKIVEITKKTLVFMPERQTRPQSDEAPATSTLYFAPIKKDKMEFVIQKATELGVGTLCPVLTAHAVVDKVNPDKMHLQAVEAAEQSERLSVPEVLPLVSLKQLLATWQSGTLYVLSERDESTDTIDANAPAAFLVGPEGGFAKEELMLLKSHPFVRFIHLGRRILRAETASVAILSVWNHLTGWR